MRTYLQMDGGRLVELVEKAEYDMLAQERADFGALVDKLERELNAAKAENEAMLDAVAVANYAICDLRLFASNECDMSLSNRALTKLRPFLK